MAEMGGFVSTESVAPISDPCLTYYFSEGDGCCKRLGCCTPSGVQCNCDRTTLVKTHGSRCRICDRPGGHQESIDTEYHSSRTNGHCNGRRRSSIELRRGGTSMPSTCRNTDRSQPRRHPLTKHETPSSIGITLTIVMLTLCTLTTTASAREWYVKVDGTGDQPTIQAAIDVAEPGDVILVAAGRYTWANQGGSDFGMIHIKKGQERFVLRSESGSGTG